MMRMLVIALCLLAAHAPAARAAWVICDDMIEGDTASAETEPEARRLALANWVQKASVLGVAYTRWQLAWNHRLTCTSEAGAVRCSARGRPCRVSQLPPPQGSTVLKPGDRPDD